MKPGRAVMTLTGLAALVEGAAASSGHYDSGHLAVLAVVGGAVALGSSALGSQFGSAAKRGETAAASEEAPSAPVTPSAPVAPPAPAEISLETQVRKAARSAADITVRVAADSSPKAEVIQAVYGVAKGAVNASDAASGVADAMASTATDKLKAAVREGASAAISAPASSAAPAMGTTARFCAGCGTPTREAARYCASCGRKLV